MTAEYYAVAAASLDSLVSEINTLKKDSWIEQGGIAVTVVHYEEHGGYSDQTYYQAMVK